jgi:hypothetical protein
MSRYISFTKLKHLIFLNGGSTSLKIFPGISNKGADNMEMMYGGSLQIQRELKKIVLLLKVVIFCLLILVVVMLKLVCKK